MHTPERCRGLQRPVGTIQALQVAFLARRSCCETCWGVGKPPRACSGTRKPPSLAPSCPSSLPLL
eukprot:5060143-Pyramimonas_sp.AAC.1